MTWREHDSSRAAQHHHVAEGGCAGRRDDRITRHRFVLLPRTPRASSRRTGSLSGIALPLAYTRPVGAGTAPTYAQAGPAYGGHGQCASMKNIERCVIALLVDMVTGAHDASGRFRARCGQRGARSSPVLSAQHARVEVVPFDVELDETVRRLSSLEPMLVFIPPNAGRRRRTEGDRGRARRDELAYTGTGPDGMHQRATSRWRSPSSPPAASRSVQVILGGVRAPHHGYAVSAHGRRSSATARTRSPKTR